MPTSEWNDMMPHRIKVRGPGAVNKYGREDFSGAFVTYRCLFDDTIQIFRNSQGEDVTVRRTAYINPEGNPITEDDEIVFMDGTKRPVVSIQTAYDVDGSIHNITVSFS